MNIKDIRDILKQSQLIDCIEIKDMVLLEYQYMDLHILVNADTDMVYDYYLD